MITIGSGVSANLLATVTIATMLAALSPIAIVRLCRVINVATSCAASGERSASAVKNAKTRAFATRPRLTRDSTPRK